MAILLKYRISPDSTATGGSGHTSSCRTFFGPVGGSQTDLGNTTTNPESGNDGIFDWKDVSHDVTALFTAGVDHQVELRYNGGTDRLHLSRPRLEDTTNLRVYRGESPRGCPLQGYHAATSRGLWYADGVSPQEHGSDSTDDTAPPSGAVIFDLCQFTGVVQSSGAGGGCVFYFSADPQCKCRGRDAYEFDGLTARVDATLATGIQGGDWTIGAWVSPFSAGGGNFGMILMVADPDGLPTYYSSQFLRFLDSTRKLWALQGFQEGGSTNSESKSNETIGLNVWTCVFAVYLATDKKIRLYKGTLDTPIAELTYSTQVAGNGTTPVSGETVRIGGEPNNLTYLFEGNIARPFVLARALTLNEMEAYRLGHQPIQDGGLRGYWPFQGPSVAVAEDLSGQGANGTPAYVVSVEGPPIARRWMTGVSSPPVTMTALTGNGTGTGSPHTTASISPSANKLILATVVGYHGSGDPEIPVVTGNGLTWVQVDTKTFDAASSIGASAKGRITVFRALSSSTPTAGAVTITYGTNPNAGNYWSIAEFGNVNTSGTNGSGAIVQSVTGEGTAQDPSVAMTATYGGNATYGAVGFVQRTGVAMAAGTGMTLIHDQSVLGHSLTTEWSAGEAAIAFNTDAIAGADNDWGIIGVEIKRA